MIVPTATFLNAADEDNIIRLYSTEGGKLVRSWDENKFLKPKLSKKGNPKEADLEAVARIGNRLYWAGSHSRDKDGNEEPSPHRLFATEMLGTGKDVELKNVGKPFTGLIPALTNGDSEVAEALRAAEKLPHEKGGIDIEGMAGTASGALLIGFRSPLVGGKAIIVELLNPAEVIESAKKPKFAKLQSFDLGGLGVRDMSSTANPQEVMIVGGSAGTEGQFQLLTWKVGEPAASKAAVDFPAKGNWEGIARDASSGKYLFAVDGGEAGSPKCKEKKHDEKSFDFRIQ